MAGFNKNPRKIIELMGEVVKTYGLQDAYVESRIETAWQVIAGEASKAVSISRYDRGKLYLTSITSTWAAEVFLRRESLRIKINEFLKGDFVKEIFIR